MLTDERLAFYKSAPYIDPWDAYQDMKLMQAEIDRLKAERIIDADWEKMIAARDEVIERLEASLEIDGVTLAEQHKQITTLKAENDRLKKILSELAYYEEHPEKFETISEENNRLTTKADAEGAEVVELKAELEEADTLIAKLQYEALADTDALKDELGEM